MRKYISILAMACLMAACSTTSGVPDGDQLYTGVDKISYENYEPNQHADQMKEEMEISLAAEPNGALFGSSSLRFPFPPNLLIWNAYHDKEGGFAKWMTSSFGKEPVLMSRVNPELRTTVAQSVLRSHGYFNGQVSHSIVQSHNPKKARISYLVNMGHLWTLDSIAYVGFPLGCDTLIHQSLPLANIRKGDPFDVTTLSSERNRISNLLRSNGYYYFQPSYSYYLADTLAVPGKAQLRFQMVDDIPEQARHRWYIGKVNVEFRKRIMDRIDTVTNYRRLSIGFSGKRPPIRPRVVLSNLRLRPNRLYNYENHLESIEKVNAMGIYSMVDFQFTPRDTTATCDTLDLKLNCVFDKPYDFYIETRATGSSVGRMGPELVVGLSKRNAFRGGEKFDIAFHGSYAWQLNGGHNNYYEYGFETSVEFPRLIAPFMGGNRDRIRRDGTRRRRRFFTTPTTLARISNNVINRPGYFNMNTITGEWTYKWQRTQTSRFQFSPIILQYQFKNRVSDKFTRLQDSLLYVSYMMEDKLVPQMRFTYTYTSPPSYRNPIAWETTISEAGNLISAGMLAFGKKWNEKNKNLYKIPYAQFLKVETDFTKTWHVGDYSTLVTHLNLGLMYTYGNNFSDTAPFSEYFYVGGATSLRGWSARYIGPADFDPDWLDNRTLRYLRMGTIKGVINLEYRPRLFGNLYGAVFLDAGNVWMHHNLLHNLLVNIEDAVSDAEAAVVPESPDTPEIEIDPEAERSVINFLGSLDRGKFSFKRLGNDLAVNTGIGLRYDLGFIMLRLDWGLGLHVPYDTGKSGYFNASPFGRDQTIHFAVGLPF